MSSKVSFKDIFVKGAVIFNPVLVQLAGLCPVVAASTSLKSAVMLSVVACAELIAVCVIASAVMKKLPRWVRMPLYLIIGLAIICPILWYVETKTLITLTLSMKIYIPLIAINSVVAVHCEQFAVKNDVKLAFYDAAAVGIGASVIFVLTGAIREILGSSSIGGMAVNIPVSFSGMLLPFGCLVILGFMAAVLKSYVSKRYPEVLEKSVPDEEEKAEEVPEEVPQPVNEPSAEDVLQEPEEIGLPAFIGEAEPVGEPEPAAEPDTIEGIRIRTEEEINEFLKSLGINTDETGDKQ